MNPFTAILDWCADIRTEALAEQQPETSAADLVHPYYTGPATPAHELDFWHTKHTNKDVEGGTVCNRSIGMRQDEDRRRYAEADYQTTREIETDRRVYALTQGERDDRETVREAGEWVRMGRHQEVWVPVEVKK